MGFRYRKSINLGGGFKINLSKSGIGYSWGVKGYRVTKTAKGTVRRTASFPGTGISYVSETNAKNHSSNNQNYNTNKNNYCNTKEIVNSSADVLSSEGMEDILSSAAKTLKIDLIANIGIAVSIILSFIKLYFLIMLALFVVLKVCVRTIWTIDLDYTIDEYQNNIIVARMLPIHKASASHKVWRIMQSNTVIDKKYTAGAGHIVNRVNCHTSSKAAFPFKSNASVETFKSGKETLIFMPDKLFVIQGVKIGAIDYSEITTTIITTRFVEEGAVPNDTSIIDHTWKYVNKSGKPDKRFKDNRQLPVCLYGEIILKSRTGLNTIIMTSNPNIN